MDGLVFVYGTLRLPGVMHAVTGRAFEAIPARIEHHACYRLKGRPYPGLRYRAGAATEGVLYRGVDALSRARLDRFEDAFYRRRAMPVLTLSGAACTAEVYLIPPKHYRLFDYRPWSLSAFERYRSGSFLRRFRRRGCSRHRVATRGTRRGEIRNSVNQGKE